MNGYKYILVPRNDLSETFDNIFPEMIKNVYSEVILFDLYPNRLKSDIRKIYSEIYASSTEVELDNANTIVLEFISGKFIFFNAAGTGGACVGEYKNEYEIYSSEEVV